MSFDITYPRGDIVMHRGDTGSYTVTVAREDGAEWTSADRMLYSIKNAAGAVVMKRAYRLDREGKNGIADIEFHNADTDTWPAGTYEGELRALINAYWSIANPPTSDVVDLLALEEALGVERIAVDGDTVRTREERFSFVVKDVIAEV